MKNPAQNTVQTQGERCTRCLQPVTGRTPRCPNCGHPISQGGRRLSLWIGVGGVSALLFVVLLMWLVVRNEDLQNAPVPVDEQTQAQQEILPETSKQAEKDTKPPEPEKQPPLNK